MLECGHAGMNQGLVTKNVTVGNLRTSLRLEPEIWEELAELCAREGLTVHQLCTLIEDYRHGDSRTSAVRAFAVTYFRMAAAESDRPGMGRDRRAGASGGQSADRVERTIRAMTGAGTGRVRGRQTPV